MYPCRNSLKWAIKISIVAKISLLSTTKHSIKNRGFTFIHLRVQNHKNPSSHYVSTAQLYTICQRNRHISQLPKSTAGPAIGTVRNTFSFIMVL